MSKFSEYLEQGIINSGMTENQLAQISGFTRSYIALMKNGQRVSRDSEKMERLLQALNLSIEEYDIIWNEYVQMRMGKEQYQKTEAVLKFMENFNHASNVNIKAELQYHIPEKLVLKGHIDIEYLIRAMIEKEAMKEHGVVYIMMQPKKSISNTFLPGICKNNEQLLVEHIVCLEKSTDTGIEKNHLYNIELLKQVVPAVACCSIDNYKVYYYYDSIASKTHLGLLLSNMILTSDHLLCFDSTMDHGILIDDSEIYDMYKTLFEEHKKSCNPMFYQMNMEECLKNGTYCLEKTAGNTCYSIATQPCLAVLKATHILKHYIKPEYNSYKGILEMQMQGNQKWIEKEENKMVSYCSKEGLIRFAEKGEVDEMVPGTYDAPNKTDRKRVLRLLIEQIESKKHDLYIISDETMKLFPELSLVVFSISNIAVRYQTSNQFLQTLLQEKSCDKIIFEAMENLMKNPSVLSMDESLEFVKGLYYSLE